MSITVLGLPADHLSHHTEHLQRCLTTTSRSTRAPVFPEDFLRA